MKFRQLLPSVIATALLLFTFSCEMPEQVVDIGAEKEKVDSIAKAAADAVMVQDFEAMDTLFTEDFTIYRSGESMSLTDFQDNLQERVSNYTGELSRDRIWVSDDATLAVYNTKQDFDITIDGEKSPITTAYMTMILTKDGDSWQVAHVCRTTPLPPMPEKMEKDTLDNDTMEMNEEEEM